MKKYYDILGLQENTPVDEITRRYKKLKIEFDPKKDKELEGFYKEQIKIIEDAYQKIILRIEKIEKINQDESKFTQKDQVTEEIKSEDETKAKTNNNKSIKEISLRNTIIVRHIDMIVSVTKYLGIMFIILGIIQIIDLIIGYNYLNDTDPSSFLPDMISPDEDFSFVMLFIFYGLIATFFFSVGSALNNFSSTISLSTNTNNQNLLNKSFEHLSSIFRRSFNILLVLIIYTSLSLMTISSKTKSSSHLASAIVMYINTPFSMTIMKFYENKMKKENRKNRNKRREIEECYW